MDENTFDEKQYVIFRRSLTLVLLRQPFLELSVYNIWITLCHGFSVAELTTLKTTVLCDQVLLSA